MSSFREFLVAFEFGIVEFALGGGESKGIKRVKSEKKQFDRV